MVMSQLLTDIICSQPQDPDDVDDQTSPRNSSTSALVDSKLKAVKSGKFIRLCQDM